MAVFTFVVKHSGGTWTAKQHGGDAELEASSASTWELQRKLTNLALTSAGSGAVSSSFSLITPTSAVAQVIVGGGGGGGFSAGSAPAASGGGSAAPAAEEKKEEKVEEKEESDDDMGFSLFD
jgi:large subunit ribosomal protein LP1